MKISMYKLEDGLTTAIWDGCEYPKGVDVFDDNELFFDIPSSVLIRPRSSESKYRQTYLLSKLRFLINYDYNLFKKACVISRIVDPKSMSLGVGLDKIVEISKFDLRLEQDNAVETTIAINRMQLVESAYFRKVDFNSKWACKKLEVLGESFAQLFAECQSWNRRFSKIIKNAIETDAIESLNTPELIFACHLKPFADLYKSSSVIRPSLNDDRFLILVAKALFLTKGKCRSNLYILLYCMGAIPSGLVEPDIKANSEMLAMVTSGNMDRKDGNYTISSGEIKIEFDASSAATLLGKRSQISDEMVEKVRETIKKEYENFKEKSFFLNRNLEMDCKTYNEGVLPSSKEHWIKYLNSLRKEWFNNLKEADEQARLRPLLCFYYIVLQNEDLESFFEESFVKDFIVMCINNPGIAINPDLFWAMYRFEVTRARISDTLSAFNAAAQSIAKKSMPECQQQLFDNAKQEINSMLQKLVDSNLINISVFNPCDNFISLIDFIICDAYFKDIIIKKPTKGYKSNVILLLNIIGILFKQGTDLTKVGNIFETRVAKDIVKTMIPDGDYNNLARAITRANIEGDKDNKLDFGKTQRIIKISKAFIEGLSKDK